MSDRGRDWLAQAEHEYEWAADSLHNGYFSGVCFLAQQIAEKALKAIAYARGADMVRGHSVLDIAKDLDINGPLRDAAARLDQYYITPRYPDSVPSGAPYEFFTMDQATEALQFAEKFLVRAREDFG